MYSSMNYQAFAGVAQLVERNLAKVEVASSSLVSRSKWLKGSPIASLFVSTIALIDMRCCIGRDGRVVRQKPAKL